MDDKRQMGDGNGENAQLCEGQTQKVKHSHTWSCKSQTFQIYFKNLKKETKNGRK